METNDHTDIYRPTEELGGGVGVAAWNPGLVCEGGT